MQILVYRNGLNVGFVSILACQVADQTADNDQHPKEEILA